MTLVIFGIETVCIRNVFSNKNPMNDENYLGSITSLSNNTRLLDFVITGIIIRVIVIAIS